MPYYDGTGPRGLGPQTGRGFGYCGHGRGYGRGFGFNRWLPTKKEEADILKDEAEALKKDLEAIEERLKDLGTGK